MNSVATIVVKKGEAETLALALQAAKTALEAEGASPGETIILAPAEASEIIFGDLDRGQARASVQKALQDLPADHCISLLKARRKTLLLADMDSTIIRVECIDELAAMMGLEDRIAPITRAAMQGEIEFGAALEQRVGLLAGLPEEALAEVYAERVRLSPGARTLVKVMRSSGARTVLVSGGFTFFSDRVREDAGFEAARSNQLEIIDGRLSGRIKGPVMDAAAKRRCLLDHCAELGIDPCDALALGDGANDLLMMEAAGLAVSYRGKPAVEGIADGSVRHTSLKTALYFQGFTADEIEAGSATP